MSHSLFTDDTYIFMVQLTPSGIIKPSLYLVSAGIRPQNQFEEVWDYSFQEGEHWIITQKNLIKGLGTFRLPILEYF